MHKTVNESEIHFVRSSHKSRLFVAKNVKKIIVEVTMSSESRVLSHNYPLSSLNMHSIGIINNGNGKKEEKIEKKIIMTKTMHMRKIKKQQQLRRV